MAFAAKVALRRDGIVTDEGKIPAIGDSLIHELETEQFDEPAANYVRLAAGVLADRFIPLSRLECRREKLNSCDFVPILVSW
jgi:hypothetical protein